jgi:hypothetical protein
MSVNYSEISQLLVNLDGISEHLDLVQTSHQCLLELSAPIHVIDPIHIIFY